MFIADGTHNIGAEKTGSPTPGQYSLLIGDNTHLRLGHATTLVRKHFGCSEYNALIRNAGFDGQGVPGNANIRVSGGTLLTKDEDFKGRLMAFVRVTGLRVDGVRFMEVFGDWNASFFDSSDVDLSDITINSGSELHEDGIHISGGSRYTLNNLNITCGDDCLAITHEPDFELDNQVLPTTDDVATNCVFHSKKANAIRIHLFPFTEPPIGDRAIRRVQLTNIVAKCGVHGEEDGEGLVIECSTGLN